MTANVSLLHPALYIQRPARCTPRVETLESVPKSQTYQGLRGQLDRPERARGVLQGPQPWSCMLPILRATDKRPIIGRRVDSDRWFVHHGDEDLVTGG